MGDLDALLTSGKGAAVLQGGGGRPGAPSAAAAAAAVAAFAVSSRAVAEEDAGVSSNGAKIVSLSARAAPALIFDYVHPAPRAPLAAPRPQQVGEGTEKMIKMLKDGKKKGGRK